MSEEPQHKEPPNKSMSGLLWSVAFREESALDLNAGDFRENLYGPLGALKVRTVEAMCAQYPQRYNELLLIHLRRGMRSDNIRDNWRTFKKIFDEIGDELGITEEEYNNYAEYTLSQLPPVTGLEGESAANDELIEEITTSNNKAPVSDAGADEPTQDDEENDDDLDIDDEESDDEDEGDEEDFEESDDDDDDESDEESDNEDDGDDEESDEEVENTDTPARQHINENQQQRAQQAQKAREKKQAAEELQRQEEEKKAQRLAKAKERRQKAKNRPKPVPAQYRHALYAATGITEAPDLYQGSCDFTKGDTIVDLMSMILEDYNTQKKTYKSLYRIIQDERKQKVAWMRIINTPYNQTERTGNYVNDAARAFASDLAQGKIPEYEALTDRLRTAFHAGANQYTVEKAGYESWANYAGPGGDARPILSTPNHLLDPVRQVARMWMYAPQDIDALVDEMLTKLPKTGTPTWDAFASYHVGGKKADKTKPSDIVHHIATTPVDSRRDLSKAARFVLGQTVPSAFAQALTPGRPLSQLDKISSKKRAARFGWDTHPSLTENNVLAFFSFGLFPSNNFRLARNESSATEIATKPVEDYTDGGLLYHVFNEPQDYDRSRLHRGESGYKPDAALARDPEEVERIAGKGSIRKAQWCSRELHTPDEMRIEREHLTDEERAQAFYTLTEDEEQKVTIKRAMVGTRPTKRVTPTAFDQVRFYKRSDDIFATSSATNIHNPYGDFQDNGYPYKLHSPSDSHFDRLAPVPGFYDNHSAFIEDDPRRTTPAWVSNRDHLYYHSIDIDINTPLIDVHALKASRPDMKTNNIGHMYKAIKEVIESGEVGIVNNELLERLYAAYKYFSDMDGILPYADMNPHTFTVHFSILTPPMRKAEHNVINRAVAKTFFDGFYNPKHLDTVESWAFALSRPGHFVKQGFFDPRVTILSPLARDFIVERLHQNWLIPHTIDGNYTIIAPADFVAASSPEAMVAFMRQCGLPTPSEETIADLSAHTRQAIHGLNHDEMFLDNIAPMNPLRYDPTTRADLAGICLGADLLHFDAAYRINMPNGHKYTIDFDLENPRVLDRGRPTETTERFRIYSGNENDNADALKCSHMIVSALVNISRLDRKVIYPTSMNTTIDGEKAAAIGAEAFALMMGDAKSIRPDNLPHFIDPDTPARFLITEGETATRFGVRALAQAALDSDHAQHALSAPHSYKAISDDTVAHFEEVQEWADREKAVMDSLANQEWYQHYVQAIMRPYAHAGVKMSDAFIHLRSRLYNLPTRKDVDQAYEEYTHHHKEHQHLLHKRFSPIDGEKTNAQVIEELNSWRINKFYSAPLKGDLAAELRAHWVKDDMLWPSDLESTEYLGEKLDNLFHEATDQPAFSSYDREKLPTLLAKTLIDREWVNAHEAPDEIAQINIRNLSHPKVRMDWIHDKRPHSIPDDSVYTSYSKKAGIPESEVQWTQFLLTGFDSALDLEKKVREKCFMHYDLEPPRTVTYKGQEIEYTTCNRRVLRPRADKARGDARYVVEPAGTYVFSIEFNFALRGNNRRTSHTPGFNVPEHARTLLGAASRGEFVNEYALLDGYQAGPHSRILDILTAPDISDVTPGELLLLDLINDYRYVDRQVATHYNDSLEVFGEKDPNLPVPTGAPLAVITHIEKNQSKWLKHYNTMTPTARGKVRGRATHAYPYAQYLRTLPEEAFIAKTMFTACQTAHESPLRAILDDIRDVRLKNPAGKTSPVNRAATTLVSRSEATDKFVWEHIMPMLEYAGGEATMLPKTGRHLTRAHYELAALAYYHPDQATWSIPRHEGKNVRFVAPYGTTDYQPIEYWQRLGKRLYGKKAQKNTYGYTTVPLLPLAYAIAHALLATSPAARHLVSMMAGNTARQWEGGNVFNPHSVADLDTLAHIATNLGFTFGTVEYTRGMEAYHRQAQLSGIDPISAQWALKDEKPENLHAFVRNVAFASDMSFTQFYHKDENGTVTDFVTPQQLITDEATQAAYYHINEHLTAVDVEQAWLAQASAYGDHGVNTLATYSPRLENNMLQLAKNLGIIGDNKDKEKKTALKVKKLSAEEERLEELKHQLATPLSHFNTAEGFILAAQEADALELQLTSSNVWVNSPHMTARVARAILKQAGLADIRASIQGMSVAMSMINTFLISTPSMTLDAVKGLVLNTVMPSVEKKKGFPAIIAAIVVAALAEKAHLLTSYAEAGSRLPAYLTHMAQYAQEGAIPADDTTPWDTAVVSEQVAYLFKRMSVTCSEQARSKHFRVASQRWERIVAQSTEEETTTRELTRDEKYALKRYKQSGGFYSTHLATFTPHTYGGGDFVRVQKIENPADLTAGGMVVWGATTEHMGEFNGEKIPPRRQARYMADLYEAMISGVLVHTQEKDYAKPTYFFAPAPRCQALAYAPIGDTEDRRIDDYTASCKPVLNDAHFGQAFTPELFTTISTLLTFAYPTKSYSADVALKVTAGLYRWAMKNKNYHTPLSARYLETLSGVSVGQCARAIKILGNLGLLASQDRDAYGHVGRLGGTLVGAYVKTPLVKKIQAELIKVEEGNSNKFSLYSQEKLLETSFDVEGGFATTYRTLTNTIEYATETGGLQSMTVEEFTHHMNTKDYAPVADVVNFMVETYQEEEKSGADEVSRRRRQLAMRSNIDLFAAYAKDSFEHAAPTTLFDVYTLIAHHAVGSAPGPINPIFTHTSTLYEGLDGGKNKKLAYTYQALAAAIDYHKAQQNSTSVVEAFPIDFYTRTLTHIVGNASYIDIIKDALGIATSALVEGINNAHAWTKRLNDSHLDTLIWRHAHNAYVATVGKRMKNIINTTDAKKQFNANPSSDEMAAGAHGSQSNPYAYITNNLERIYDNAGLTTGFEPTAMFLDTPEYDTLAKNAQQTYDLASTFTITAAALTHILGVGVKKLLPTIVETDEEDEYLYLLEEFKKYENLEEYITV